MVFEFAFGLCEEFYQVQLMYSSGAEALIYKNETGHKITYVEKLKDNWYWVETDY